MLFTPPPSRLRRPPPRMEEKPVANVQPVQSTPTPTMPCQASAEATDPSEGSLGGFPINYLHKAGVFVQKIVTCTGRLFLSEALCAIAPSIPTCGQQGYCRWSVGNVKCKNVLKNICINKCDIVRVILSNDTDAFV